MATQDNPEKWSQVVLRLKAQMRERERRWKYLNVEYNRLARNAQIARLLHENARKVNISLNLRLRLYGAAVARENACRNMRLMGVQ